jgi:hypothetical protein
MAFDLGAERRQKRLEDALGRLRMALVNRRRVTGGERFVQKRHPDAVRATHLGERLARPVAAAHQFGEDRQPHAHHLVLFRQTGHRRI